MLSEIEKDAVFEPFVSTTLFLASKMDQFSEEIAPKPQFFLQNYAKFNFATSDW